MRRLPYAGVPTAAAAAAAASVHAAAAATADAPAHAAAAAASTAAAGAASACRTQLQPAAVPAAASAKWDAALHATRANPAAAVRPRAPAVLTEDAHFTLPDITLNVAMQGPLGTPILGVLFGTVYQYSAPFASQRRQWCQSLSCMQTVFTMADICCPKSAYCCAYPCWCCKDSVALRWQARRREDPARGATHTVCERVRWRGDLCAGLCAGRGSMVSGRLELQSGKKSCRRKRTTHCSCQGCLWTFRSARPPTSSAPLRATRSASPAPPRTSETQSLLPTQHHYMLVLCGMKHCSLLRRE